MALFDHDAEARLLGAVLLRPRLVGELHLQHDDFHDPIHAALWRACLALAGRDFDGVELRRQAARDGSLSDRLAERLAAIEAEAVTAANAHAHADAIRDLSTRRRMIGAAERISRLAGDPTRTLADVQAEFERAVLDATRSQRRGEPVPMRDAMSRYFAEVQEARKQDDGLLGLPTGLPKFDARYKGLRRGAVYVVAARPGNGKSTLALQFAIMAGKRGVRSLVFSLEMAAEELAPRGLAAELKCPEDRALERIGRDERFMGAYAQAVQRLSELPIDIDDGISSTLPELRAQARRHRLRYPDLGLIVVDYLQLLQMGRRRSEHRESEVAEISRGLKLLAAEMKLPVVVLSQMNRNSEREKRPPVLSDLRDSGAVEQDADAVLFLHRCDPSAAPGEHGAIEMELIVAKMRKGPTGYIPLVFFTEWSLFAERAVGAGEDCDA
jgi:replicative DNA helicase